MAWPKPAEAPVINTIMEKAPNSGKEDERLHGDIPLARG
jgi:hypothetical protein